MIQIIDENRKRSFGDKINQGLAAGLDQLGKYKQEYENKQAFDKETEAMSKLTGMDFSDIKDPALRQKAFGSYFDAKNTEAEYGFKEQLEGLKAGQKKKSDIPDFKGALSTIAEMRKIRSKGNLGVGTNLWSKFGGETAKDSGAYSQLGKSLISFASNIPIRNKAEFETLAEKLYNPNLTDNEAEGILSSMEKIVMNGMKAAGVEDQEMLRTSGNQGLQAGANKPERKPLTSFKR